VCGYASLQSRAGRKRLSECDVYARCSMMACRLTCYVDACNQISTSTSSTLDQDGPDGDSKRAAGDGSPLAADEVDDDGNPLDKWTPRDHVPKHKQRLLKSPRSPRPGMTALCDHSNAPWSLTPIMNFMCPALLCVVCMTMTLALVLLENSAAVHSTGVLSPRRIVMMRTGSESQVVHPPSPRSGSLMSPRRQQHVDLHHEALTVGINKGGGTSPSIAAAAAPTGTLMRAPSERHVTIDSRSDPHSDRAKEHSGSNTPPVEQRTPVSILRGPSVQRLNIESRAVSAGSATSSASSSTAVGVPHTVESDVLKASPVLHAVARGISAPDTVPVMMRAASADSAAGASGGVGGAPIDGVRTLPPQGRPVLRRQSTTGSIRAEERQGESTVTLELAGALLNSCRGVVVRNQCSCWCLV